MDTLTRILRRRPYLPFTEPRWRGTFPFAAARRVTSANTNPSLKFSLSTSGLSSPARPKLYLYEDRRRWHPEGANALPRSMVQFRTRMQERPPNFQDNEIYNPRTGELIYTTGSQLNQTSFKPWKIAFDNPWKTIICLKRKMRKEIIHAMGLGGKAQSRKQRWTQYSYVRCF